MRIPFVLSLSAVLVTHPVLAQEVGLRFEAFELANGLRVIVHEDHAIPMAAVNLWYHVGSAHEEPGRTGFAHLFEHLMFEGSAHVPEGEFDNLLEAVGALGNGTTTSDRTNYFVDVPINALELALWLEADRMGGLLETMTPEKLDGQREIVKNERREVYENRPYGLFYETSFRELYPAGHPYSWSTIGSLEDLERASVEDVERFFQRYYVPNNAVLVIAGDVRTDEVRALVERYFGWIPRGAPVPRLTPTTESLGPTRYLTMEDRVTLPQVNLMWRTTPAYARGDAALSALSAILTEGKNSRLFRRLVYEEQVAQDVISFNYSRLLSGDFYLRITGREGIELDGLEGAALEEIARLAEEGPAEEELQRVVSSVETRAVGALESLESRADMLNHYYYYTGDPDYAAEELERYRSLTPADIQDAAREYLAGRSRLVISIVPPGEGHLAAGEDR